jgi:hypothetical protein
MAEQQITEGADGVLLVRNVETGEIHRLDSFANHYEYTTLEAGIAGAAEGMAAAPEIDAAPPAPPQLGASTSSTDSAAEAGETTRLVDDPSWLMSALSLNPWAKKPKPKPKTAAGGGAAAAAVADDEDEKGAGAGGGGSSGGGGGGGGGGLRRSASDFSLGTGDDRRKPCLEDFTLLRVVGKGSFGKVILVRKKDSDELFAMKVLSKPNVVLRKQVEHTRTERRVLGAASSPFVVRLHAAFQTEEKLYFVLDYCAGGELFFHLSRAGKFPEEVSRFYTAELLLALEHLHAHDIVYRDMKPENVLLDSAGHVKLADFGLAKDGVKESTTGASSLCGTPEYLAPEILARLGHGKAVDWWGLGMLLYEMLTGLPPWYTRDKKKLFLALRSAPLQFPDYISDIAKSFIGGLLDRNPQERLGGVGDAEAVKAHGFFRCVCHSFA